MRGLNKKTCNTYYTSNTGTLGSYLSDIAKYKLLSDEDFNNEIIKAKRGDQEAITKIVNANQRFVFSLAKKFSNGNNDLLSDLINEANIGLLTSIKRFDPQKDIKFLTYSVYWMQRQVILFLTFTEPIVKVSNKAKTTKVSQIKNRFFLMNGRTPTSEEILDELQEKYGIEISNESDIFQMSTMSVDGANITENYDDFSSYFLANSDGASESDISSTNDYEKEIDKSYSKMLISKSIGALSERERNVVELLYGINDYRQYKIQEVAQKLGITNEAVRLIEKRALKKLEEKIIVERLFV